MRSHGEHQAFHSGIFVGALVVLGVFVLSFIYAMLTNTYEPPREPTPVIEREDPPANEHSVLVNHREFPSVPDEPCK